MSQALDASKASEPMRIQESDEFHPAQDSSFEFGSGVLRANPGIALKSGLVRISDLAGTVHESSPKLRETLASRNMDGRLTSGSTAGHPSTQHLASRF